jgi:hypothetical protein
MKLHQPPSGMSLDRILDEGKLPNAGVLHRCHKVDHALVLIFKDR